MCDCRRVVPGCLTSPPCCSIRQIKVWDGAAKDEYRAERTRMASEPTDGGICGLAAWHTARCEPLDRNIEP